MSEDTQNLVLTEEEAEVIMWCILFTDGEDRIRFPKSVIANNLIEKLREIFPKI